MINNDVELMFYIPHLQLDYLWILQVLYLSFMIFWKYFLINKIPISLCFNDYDPSEVQNFFSLFVMSFYFIDILLTFNTGFKKEFTEEIVLDRYLILKNYLKFWFWIDLFSTLPYQ